VTLRELRPDISLPGTSGRPATAFVLGGGGNLGAIQVGMLRALYEQGARPDALFGCSVGAINSAVLAGDPSMDGIERLADIWRNLDGDVICPPGRLSGLLLLTRKYRSLQSNDALHQLLERAVDYRLIEESAVPLEVVATSLYTGREQWFRSGPLIPAVLASCALPAVLPPVEINGERFIDGAVVDNVPISRAVAAGAGRIYVLHVGNFERPRPEPKRPIDALLQSFSIARSYRFQMEVRSPAAGVELIVLPSIDPGPVRPNDFGKSRVLMERAYAAATAFLESDRPIAVGH
jgi:NTE family protein